MFNLNKPSPQGRTSVDRDFTPHQGRAESAAIYGAIEIRRESTAFLFCPLCSQSACIASP
jgi:hypothetical protein